MIAISALLMRFGSKILFENVSLQLNPGRRYGLVGANGSGKSTLLKILSGELSPDKGEISTPSHLSIGTMAQDHFLYDDEPVLNVVLQGKPILWKALQQRQELWDSHAEFGEEACRQLEQIEQTIAQQDGYAAESSAAKLLEGLGIPEEKHPLQMKILSGGNKLRVLLAQLLFADTDILLLDEPTNHLDLFTISWLESYLQSFKGTLVVVSHDRTFLNNVSTDILDVDHGTIRLYPANYDVFVAMKAEMHLQLEKQLLSQEKKRDQLMEFVERFGAKATKARQAQSKMHQVEKLDQSMAEKNLAPSSRRSPHVDFSVEKASGVRVLQVEDLCKCYGSHQVFEGVSLEIERGEKVAFLGANGIGKTTFLEVLIGNLEATAGKFSWGINADYSYFPQDPRRALDHSQTALESLCGYDRNLSEQQIRGILGKVLIEGDAVHQKIATLSGGEVARVLLAKMMIKKGNVLIFDEPTNHLDMESIEVLLEALNEYQGTVLLVSHNRYFVSSFAVRIIEIQPQGILNYSCTYDEYIEKRQLDLLSRDTLHLQMKSPFSSKDAAARGTFDKTKEQRRKRTQLEREIQALEEESARYEQEIHLLDIRLADSRLYSNDSREELEKMVAQKKEWENKLEKCIQRWEAANQFLLN